MDNYERENRHGLKCALDKVSKLEETVHMLKGMDAFILYIVYTGQANGS